MESFKVDTKEKFNVITPIISHLSDIKTGELKSLAIQQLEKVTKNVILNFSHLQSISVKAAEIIAETAADFLEKNASFVICEVAPSIKTTFNDLELLDILNITPTESEAWDIVQMEEIERDLLADDEV